MSKREWGAKHTCMSCGVKLYDLNRNPIACPKCGTVIEAEIGRPGRRRPAAQPQPIPPSGADAGVAGTGGETSDDDKAIIDDDINDEAVGDIDDAEATRPAT